MLRPTSSSTWDWYAGDRRQREICVNLDLIAGEALKLEVNLIPEIQGITTNKRKSCGYCLT